MRKAIFIAFLTFLASLTFAQSTIGFVFQSNQPRVKIPFTLINNLVIIPVTVNNTITLKFILDTGANNPILTEKVFGDVMGLKYDRQILIDVPGIADSITAYVASDVSLSLPQGVHGRHFSILVLEEDYIELKKNLGEEIYGIIGYEIFSRFVVEINYDSQEITLYDPARFKPRKKYHAFRISLENTKPYINSVITQKDMTDTMKLMVDIGASHALLLDIDESKVLTRPDSLLETSLGHGLGGEIPGKIGRLSEFQMGYYEIENLLVSIPDPGAYSNSIKRGSRHGTIGGSLMKRLNPIFDYHNGYIYLKKGKYFREPFNYDMSGLRIAYLEDPDRIKVTAVADNSPAKEAGIEVGDIILSINGRNILDHRLSEVYGELRSRENKKIRIQLERNDQRMQFEFHLRKMI